MTTVGEKLGRLVTRKRPKSRTKKVFIIIGKLFREK